MPTKPCGETTPLQNICLCSILKSGLSTFVLRKKTLEPLSIFQRKSLRSILKLSKSAANCALFFLFGELPIEGKVHRDVFSLLYSICSNPDTKIYQVVKYLMSNSCDNSGTWSVFVKQLSRMYSIEDPVKCLEKDTPLKSRFKEHVITKITAFHESELREQAKGNSTYLWQVWEDDITLPSLG